MKISIYGKEIECARAVKTVNGQGLGSLDVLDANGNTIAKADEISDFTGYHYYDDTGKEIEL